MSESGSYWKIKKLKEFFNLFSWKIIDFPTEQYFYYHRDNQNSHNVSHYPIRIYKNQRFLYLDVLFYFVK